MDHSASASGPIVARTRPEVAALLVAVSGAAAAVGLWIVLASITGLIYHFMPGAPFLAAAWSFRQVAGSR
ncbi:MAG: hypothetical protein MUQ32_00555, partial [Chloroflexi bacterium]|nr:hypothetical protein [Chloroflexota bacterium]